MPEIDPVVVKLIADTADYRREMDGVAVRADASLARVEERGRRMGGALARGFDVAKVAAAGFIAAIGVDTFTRLVSGGLNYASSLGEVAAQLGVTTDALQEYRFAGSQAGLSVEEVDQALSQFTRRIGEAAAGTKEQAAAFAQLGIAVRGSNGEVKETGELIPEVADAMARIESPAERARLQMDLFGRAGQKLDPLLSEGAAGVNALRDAAHRLGIVLSAEQIARADETADKLSAVKQVLEANIAGAVANNANAIMALANAFANVVTAAGNALVALQRWNRQVELQNRLRIAENTAEGGLFGLSYTRAEREAADREAISIRGQMAFGTPTPMPRRLRQPIGGRGGTAAPVNPSGGGGNGGSSGPSAEEQRRRAAQEDAQFADDLGRLRVESLRLLAELNGSVTARRDAELADIEESRASFARRLALDDGLTDARREQLLAARDEADATRRAAAEQEANIALADAAGRRALAGIEAETDAAQFEYDMAGTNAERLQIAYRLIDLAQRAERAELERVLATERTNSVEADIAEARLAELDAVRDRARKRAEQDNASPLARFLSDNSTAKLAEQAEQLIVDQLQAVRDSIAGAITSQIEVRDPLISGLLRILLQEVLINPIARALQDAGGKGGFSFGSFFSTAISSIFGRASGGFVAPGQMVRVNEGAARGRVEGFIPTGSGKIVPLGQMNAMAARAGGGEASVRIVIEEAEGFATRVQTISTGVAVNVTRQAAPSIIGAARDATLREAGRTKL
jgi:hypothetical protein